MSEKGKSIMWVMVGVVFALIMGFVVPAAQFYKTPPKSKTIAPKVTATATPAPVTVELPQMPQEYKYAIGARIYSRYTLTDIEVEVKKYFDDYNIVLKVAGEKTGDFKGVEGTNNGYIQYKLYDEEGYVADTGTIMLPSYSVGDKFRDVKEYIYGIPAGHYRLELKDYK